MVRALLDNLKALDIQLWVEGDKLKWDAPAGLVKGKLKEQMWNHKAELFTLLRDKEADGYHQGCDSTSSKEKQDQSNPELEDIEKELPLNTTILGDCLEKLKTIPDNSIDLIVTDPPYGIKFMGKKWDKAIPIINIWKECLRVLKPGAFAFIMSAPRQDQLSRMIINLEDAGFKIGFSSLYWTYAPGFPKARNISKAIDKKLGGERKKMGRNPNSRENCDKSNTIYESGTAGKIAYHTEPATEEAKRLEGSYAGFQLKPAVEVIIVAMKPCDKKTYTDQALSNGKGVTWMDDCKIPFDGENARVPANLVVSDDTINDGRKDPGGFSRFFSLDAWAEIHLQDLPEKVQKNLPFLIVPKASRKEKNAGLDNMQEKKVNDGRKKENDTAFQRGATLRKNTHPTVKSIKLMAYLITMGCRENDIVLDPFAGSGTTCMAAKLLNRNYIGVEISSEYQEMADLRIENADKDNAIIKLIRESFNRIKDVKLEKNNKAPAKEKLKTHIVCSKDAELRINVLP